MKKASKQKGAGRPSGDVTIDLGEVVEKKLRAAGLRTEVGKSAQTSKSAAPAGAYRPGMFGGYRPWYSRFGRPWLGQETATDRRFTLIPASIQTVKTGDVATGLGLGILGNRSLVRLTPLLWENKPTVLHNGIAFVAGLIPLLFKRNGTTLGVAMPGAVMLGGSLVDLIFNAIGLPKGRVSDAGMGAQEAPRGEAALEARRKLAAIQQRINLAQAQGPRPQVPRVVARPQFA